MNIVAIFAIAFALAVDAFIVAFASGIRLKRVTLFQTLQISGMFGGFQFAMPVIAWWLGNSAYKYIEPYDHWIAFVLLAFVGARMIKEALSNKSDQTAYNPTRFSILVLLGIATSLDAFAVGLSFAFLQMNIWIPALIIGVVCFCLSSLGLHIGRLITRLPKLGLIGNQSNIIGGVLLIGIGLHTLQQHGVFG